VMPLKFNATKVVWAPRILWLSTKMQAIQSKPLEKSYCVAGCQIRNGNNPHKLFAPDGFRFKAFISICNLLLVVVYQMLRFISISFSLEFEDDLHRILLAHNNYVLTGSSRVNGGPCMMLHPPPPVFPGMWQNTVSLELK
jgi:hypothetical protein